MRAHEFISEATHKPKPMRKGSEWAAPNLTIHDKLSNNMNPYQSYRFGVSLAHAPDTRDHNATEYASNFVMIDYTEADAEIRRAAERAMGIDATRSTGAGSVELPTVNKVSPVAKPKKNKYGV